MAAGCRYFAAGRNGQANSALRAARKMQLQKVRLTSIEDAPFAQSLDRVVAAAEDLQRQVEQTRNVAFQARLNRIRSGKPTR